MAPNIRPLSKELQQVALEELNEVPSRLEDDIEAIRKWISQVSHMKSRDDDQFIICFLRGCKFSLEKAKNKIEQFYTARTVTPEFFANRDVEDKTLQEIMDKGFILPLPVDESSSEPRVILTRLGHFDPDKFKFLDVMKVSYLMADRVLLESDVTIIAGHVSVVDLRGCGMNIMCQVGPALIKKLSSLLEPFPIRIKAIHLVHPPKAIEAAFKIFYSVCHEKLKKRIYVHATFDDLNKALPELHKHMPKEFGGPNSNLDDIIAKWKKDLLANRKWFLDDEQYRVTNVNPNENANGEMFGMGGSFRSLNID